MDRDEQERSIGRVADPKRIPAEDEAGMNEGRRIPPGAFSFSAGERSPQKRAYA